MFRFTNCLAAVVVLVGVGQKVALADPGDLLQTFPNPTGEQGVWFGSTITAVGDNVLFGVGYDGTGSDDAGVAYLFDGETATPLHTFLNPNPHNGDLFGRAAVAVGDNVLISAQSSIYAAAPQPGIAYLFNTSGDLLQTFHNPFPGAGDGFGCSIAAVGGNVVISAPNDDTRGGNAGAAYLFNTAGGLIETFYSPATGGGQYFGNSVAAVGDNILVGAGGTGKAAYLFDTSGNLLQTFPNPVGAGNYFGQYVAAVGNDVLISAFGGAGAAYLFDTDTGSLLDTFLDPTPGPNDLFGRSVAGVAGNVLVGGYSADAGGTRTGTAFLFDSSSGDLLQTFETGADDIVDINVASLANNVLIGGGSSGYLFEGEPIPEPSTLILLTIGAVSLLAYGWQRRRVA